MFKLRLFPIVVMISSPFLFQLILWCVKKLLLSWMVHVSTSGTPFSTFVWSPVTDMLGKSVQCDRGGGGGGGGGG